MMRHATLTEVETSWSLKDLMDYHEAQDIQEEAEEYIRTHPPKE